ncbi:MAG: TetR/AcrR family transcriptional regulator [Alphaproteobacteria bacterium]
MGLSSSAVRTDRFVWTEWQGLLIMAANRRDHLVDTALKLFYREGFHATGIEKILAESGVAKMTLYKHFKSKDELILAAVRRRDEQIRNWLMRTVERRSPSPRERLLAMFDVLEEWFSGPEFAGCMFINASAEFGKDDDPIHAASAEHKRLVFAYVRELATAAGAKNPEELAEQLILIMEGAMSLAHVTGQASVARQARKAAEILVARALA